MLSLRYTLTSFGPWSCDECGALVVFTSVHDAWHEKEKEEA